MGLFGKRRDNQPATPTPAPTRKPCPHRHYSAERVSPTRMTGHCRDCGKPLTWAVNPGR